MNPPVALEAIRLDESVGEPGQALAGLPTPEPVPDLHAYLRERRIRLSCSPEALANYLAFMASERRSAEVDYLPIRLDFENVSRCNFRCTMCTVSEWPKGRRAADMALADFERLLDEQVGLVEVKVQGLGEPTHAGRGLLRHDPPRPEPPHLGPDHHQRLAPAPEGQPSQTGR